MLAQKSSSDPSLSGGPPASGGPFESDGGPCESGGSFGPGTTGECSNRPGGYPSPAARAGQVASTAINTRIERFMAGDRWHRFAQWATGARHPDHSEARSRRSLRRPFAALILGRGRVESGRRHADGDAGLECGEGRARSLIPPNKCKKNQGNPRKKAWISLDSFGRIGAFQWVTANPNKNSFPFCLRRRRPRRTHPSLNHNSTASFHIKGNSERND